MKLCHLFSGSQIEYQYKWILSCCAETEKYVFFYKCFIIHTKKET
jgi:hypothetical protein